MSQTFKKNELVYCMGTSTNSRVGNKYFHSYDKFDKELCLVGDKPNDEHPTVYGVGEVTAAMPSPGGRDTNEYQKAVCNSTPMDKRNSDGTIKRTISKEGFEYCLDQVFPTWISDNGVEYRLENGKRIFKSGACRSDNKGKSRPDLISPLAIRELGDLLGREAEDKGSANYLKGIPEKVCVESLMRHLNEYQITGSKDEAVAVLANAMFLVHTIEQKIVESREKFRKARTASACNLGDYSEFFQK